MDDTILETWDTHSKLNVYLTRSIPEEAFSARPFGRGRSVGQVIAHIHNNRLDWLIGISPGISDGLRKVDRNQTEDKESILVVLGESADAVLVLLMRSMLTGGKVRGFGDHAAKFMGYLIAHEAYHHGEIGIMLTQAGFPLPKEVTYGLWDWKQK